MKDEQLAVVSCYYVLRVTAMLDNARFASVSAFPEIASDLDIDRRNSRATNNQCGNIH